MEENKKSLFEIFQIVIIIWSLKKKDYWQNIDYLEAEWSFQDVVNFIDKVDYTIAIDKKNIEFISTLQKRQQSCHYETNNALLQNKF
jgi:hypothetical protein